MNILYDYEVSFISKDNHGLIIKTKAENDKEAIENSKKRIIKLNYDMYDYKFKSLIKN